MIIDFKRLGGGSSERAALADNLTSWDARGQVQVSSSFSDAIRTTGGSLSIDSTKSATLTKIVANGLFYATAFCSSGANLLNPSQTVDGAAYFPVPKMLQGSYGTMDEANGILFVDKNGNNLHPTVRYSATLPVSAEAGTAVTPYQFSGHDEYFYPASAAGYFIVSGLTTPANVCARIAWSKNYSTYVAYAAPSSITLSSIIAAIAASHTAISGNMHSVGSAADQIVFGASSATWTRKVDIATPTWTSTLNEDEETYTHTATISTMKSYGSVALVDGSHTLTIAGTTVSFVDSNSSYSGSVIFELATPVTGTVSMANTYTANDFGIEYFTDAGGAFTATTNYYQEIPDTVYGLISQVTELDSKIGNIDTLLQALL